MVGSLPDLPDLGAPSVDAHAHLAMLDDPVAGIEGLLGLDAGAEGQGGEN